MVSLRCKLTVYIITKSYHAIQRVYSIKESGFGYIVNLGSDSHGKLNITVT